MKITPSELLELGKWDRYCKLKGMNVWAINEGLVDSKELLPLTLEEAEQLSIISR